MEEPRPRDRLDRRLATRRLRGRHLRAVARALAARRAAEPGGDQAAPREGVGPLHDRLGCRRVWVSRHRSVHLADPASADVAGDVAALARDLQVRGASRRAEQLIAAYALAADDYEIYRAVAFPTSRRRLVIATGGPIASGKSTLAKRVSRRLALARVVADRVRAALLAPLPARISHEIDWDPDFATRIYCGLLERAEPVLASGRSVVLDACFPRAAQRRAGAALAERHGARFVFLHCDPPPATVAARLGRRSRRGRGDWGALARAAHWEPLGADEPGRHWRVDTAGPQARSLRDLERAARERA